MALAVQGIRPAKAATTTATAPAGRGSKAAPASAPGRPIAAPTSAATATPVVPGKLPGKAKGKQPVAAADADPWAQARAVASSAGFQPAEPTAKELDDLQKADKFP